MNNTDKAKEIQKARLDNFASATFWNNKMKEDIFAMKERDDLIKFKKHNINIPWYLMPFMYAITNIAYSSFKNGLSESCTDTVTFKRPAPYKVEDDE